MGINVNGEHFKAGNNCSKLTVIGLPLIGPLSAAPILQLPIKTQLVLFLKILQVER